MSWGPITASSVAAEEIAAALEAAAADYEHALQVSLEAQDAGLDDEAKEQIAAGTAVALDLAGSAAFGEGPFTVSLSGHANPGHQPTAGFSNDYLAVTFSSAAAAAAPEPAPEPAPEQPAETPAEPAATDTGETPAEPATDTWTETGTETPAEGEDAAPADQPTG